MEMNSGKVRNWKMGDAKLNGDRVDQKWKMKFQVASSKARLFILGLVLSLSRFSRLVGSPLQFFFPPSLPAKNYQRYPPSSQFVAHLILIPTFDSNPPYDSCSPTTRLQGAYSMARNRRPR